MASFSLIEMCEPSLIKHSYLKNQGHPLQAIQDQESFALIQQLKNKQGNFVCHKYRYLTRFKKKHTECGKAGSLFVKQWAQGRQKISTLHFCSHKKAEIILYLGVGWWKSSRPS